MADLYRVDSPINRGQRNNLNLTFEDILKRFSNLQRQINILAGDNDVDELINRIADALTNSEATLSDLQTALTDAQQVIDDMITATTNATNATNAANQATTDVTQLFNDMTALQTDLEQLQTSLNQTITDANQATNAANTSTNNTNRATQEAQQATTDANNAASRANDAAESIEGWGQAAPYQSGTYNRNNVVTFEGSTYQSLIDDNTSIPTDNTKWILLARKGLDGQGAVQTVNEKSPNEQGDVELGLSDIDGLEAILNEKANDENLTFLEQTVTKHLNESKMYLNFMDAFREPTLSKELFTLPTGINEFSLIYVDSYYHLFYDDKFQSKHRQATTIVGLQSAVDDVTVDGRYPWIYYEKGVWHLWVRDNNTLITKHYTAMDVQGPYIYSDDCLTNKSDWKVFKNPVNGNYFATYKDVISGFAGVAVSDGLIGEWNDLGYVFSESGRAHWHAYEEADATLVFVSERAYLLFAGWDSIAQRIGIVEVDTSTFKAINTSTVLVNPEESWHLRNGMRKVFSPVYLEYDNRIYYAQNPSDAVEAGWGFLDHSQALQPRRKHDILRVDFKSKRNTAVNMPLEVYGSVKFESYGMTTANSNYGGVYGSLASSMVNDFTAQVEFTINDLPSGYARLLSATETGEDGSVIGIWMNGQKVYLEIRNRGSSEFVTYAGTTDLNLGGRHKVSLRRYGSEVIAVVDGSVVHTATFSMPITLLKEFSISNAKGYNRAGEQQFSGTIHSALLVGEALPISLL